MYVLALIFRKQPYGEFVTAGQWPHSGGILWSMVSPGFVMSRLSADAARLRNTVHHSRVCDCAL